MDRNRLLTIGAVLAAVIVIALGYVVGVSPQLRAAATARSDDVSVTAQNDVLRSGVTTLESKSTKLESLTTQLATLQRSVPADASSAAFLTEINSLAVKSGVGVVTLTMGDAQAYVAPVAPGGTSKAAAGVAPVAPASVTNPAITTANFSVIPVTVTVAGTYGQALDFLSQVHSGERLYLVTAFAGSNGSSADGTSGNWTVTGSIYALTDATTAQQSQQQPTSTASDATTDGAATDTAAGK